LLHVLHKGIEFYTVPKNLRLDPQTKTGSFSLPPMDLKKIATMGRLFLMSYKDSKAYMEREIVLNSISIRTGVAFFNYHEPISWPFPKDFAKDIIEGISKYYHLHHLVNSLNILLENTKGENLSFGLFEKWLESLLVPVPDEAAESVKYLLSKFSFIYTTKIFGSAFRGDLDEITRRSHEVAFKLYEIIEK